MRISLHSREDLLWWYHNLSHQKRIIRISPPDRTIYCDASSEGWGASFEGKKTGGRWSFDEMNYHINVLELMAIEYALKSLCKDFQNEGISILSDNTTAIAYLKNGGGTRSIQCNDLAKNIWQWCAHKNIWFMVTHIPGIENVEADYESRHFTENTEWSLHPDIFANVIQNMGKPDVDLFASKNNFQVKPYVSWGPDPFAIAVNAFHIKWNSFDLCYIFPPFRLLNRVLQKIFNERARAIVIAPDWPAQPWYANIHRKSRKTLYFNKQNNNLLRTEQSNEPTTKSIHDTPLCAFLLY